MEDQLIAIVKYEFTGIVEHTTNILRIGNVKECVLTIAVLVEVEGMRSQIEQISSCLHIGLDGIDPVVIDIAKSQFHDEQILVVITKDGVT